MKISKNLKQVTTTQTEIAKALGMTQQRVSQLVKNGVVIRDDTGAVLLIDSLINYYKSNHGNNQLIDNLSFETERSLHEKAKREIAELHLAEMKNEMHFTADIELMVGGMVTVFKKKMLALPYKVAQKLVAKSADDINEILTNEITSSLTELSTFDAAKLGDEFEYDTEENS